MITLPIIQAICFLTYIWIVVSMYGILPSVSESWYREGSMKYMFIIFICILSGATMLLFSKSLWFLASGGSLLIVAFAPAFRSDNKIVGILHTAGTIGGIAFACYALLTHGIYFPTICCLVGSILLDRFKVENSTWWVEIADFIFIVMGVFQLITLSL